MSRLSTYSGRSIDPLYPSVEDLDIRDIAHSLSLQCRFNGHCRQFYSVADHSLRVSKVLPDSLALWGLLHDAAEAYLCDLPRPIKVWLPTYCKAEEVLLRFITKYYGLSWPMPDAVKQADDKLLLTEARDLMGFKEPPPWGISEIPLEETIIALDSQQAEHMFLQRFTELTD